MWILRIRNNVLDKMKQVQAAYNDVGLSTEYPPSGRFLLPDSLVQIHGKGTCAQPMLMEIVTFLHDKKSHCGRCFGWTTCFKRI
jgi:hypothetical protein